MVMADFSARFMDREYWTLNQFQGIETENSLDNDFKVDSSAKLEENRDYAMMSDKVVGE